MIKSRKCLSLLIISAAFNTFDNNYDNKFILDHIYTHHGQQNALYPQRWQVLEREFLALPRFMLC